jgi:hypothetical protein
MSTLALSLHDKLGTELRHIYLTWLRLLDRGSDAVVVQSCAAPGETKVEEEA